MEKLGLIADGITPPENGGFFDKLAAQAKIDNPEKLSASQHAKAKLEKLADDVTARLSKKVCSCRKRRSC